MKAALHVAMALLLGASLSLAAAADENVESTISAARRAAHDDRNAEAAKLFENAVAAAPDRRLALLPELSDQLTYSGKADQAVPLYRESLAAHELPPDARRHVELGLALALAFSHKLPESQAMYGDLLARNPRDVEALLGHARVLSYQDQLTPALREYERVLTIDPANHEALESVARVQSWRGRFRDAQQRARALLAQNKNDVGAALTLAQAQLWMGRPDLAGREQRSIQQSHPDDATVRSLALDLADAKSSSARLSASSGTQSDNLLIRNGTFEAEAHAAQGASSFGVHYEPISYVGRNDAGDATERRLGFFGHSRFSDWGEIHAGASNDSVSATGSAGSNLLLYDTYLTLWPNDTFRFDVGSRKETFDNLSSLRLGITAVFNSLSMDVTPTENDRVTLRADLGRFTDGNRRAWEQVELEHAVVRRPRLSFGARGTNYSFSEQLFNGYFDPPRYQSAEATTHLYGNAQGRLYYDAAATYGREWVLDGGARATHSLHGTLSYVVSRPISVSAFYDSFDTRQTSNSGFERTVVGLRLQSRW